MFGLGGIYTEVLDDVVFRIAPITERDAHGMMESIAAAALLGSIRGLAEADRPALAAALIALGDLGITHEEITAIDVNPLILRSDGTPIAVDASVWLASR